MPVHKFASVAVTLMTILFAASPAHSDEYGAQQYHIESHPVQSVVALLTYNTNLPGFIADHWRVFVPYAPELGSQRNVVETLDIVGKDVASKTYYGLGTEHHRMLCADVDDHTVGGAADLGAVATIKCELYSRALVAGPPVGNIVKLTRTESVNYTAVTHRYDYSSRIFQEWLTVNSLNRAPKERDLPFARRVFDLIRGSYNYRYMPYQNRSATDLTTEDWSDCGGLSTLFVAVLRANHIPAVILPGHLAISGSASDDYESHVKSVFYAEGIGWVPVEMSGACSDKDAPAEVYFGRENGDFIALCMDCGVVVNWGYGGVRPYDTLQSINLWLHGKGPLGTTQDVNTMTWHVASHPLEQQ